MPVSSQSVRHIWRHVRLLLVATHVVAIVFMSIPNPAPGMNRSAWQNPTVQGELKTWAERLSGVGITVTPAALEDWAYSTAMKLVAFRTTLTAPFDPYNRYAGVRQPWNMFVAPHRHPALMTVDIEIDGKWIPIYRVRSAEYDYRRDFFDHDRLRAMSFRYGWPNFRSSYNDFARWLAKQIAVDFPTATKARIQLERHQTPSPEDVRKDVPVKVTTEARVVLALDPFRETSP